MIRVKKVFSIILPLLFLFSSFSYAVENDFANFLKQARYLRDKKDYKEALKNYKKVLDLKTSENNIQDETINVICFFIIESIKRKKTFEDSMEEIDDIFGSDNFFSQKFTEELSVADSFIKEKKLEYAIAYLKKVKKTSPLKLLANYNICSCYIVLMKPAKEEKSILKQIEYINEGKEYCSKLPNYIDNKDEDRFNKHLAFAYGDLGYYYYQKKKYKKASQALKKSIDINKQDSFYLKFYGDILFNLGETKKGISFVEKSLIYTEKKDISETYFDLAELYSLDNNPKMSLLYLKQAISLDKNYKKDLLRNKELKNISNTKEFIEMAK